jgi:threonine dehydrogenase-like Zn-dependent dehydrogenase
MHCREGHWIYCLHAPPSESHFKEYVKKQEGILPILPDDISFELGSLAGCALCPGFEALHRMEVTAFDTVLVTGLGPVGLGTAAIAAFRGARVLGVEPEPFRRELAMELGAEAVFDPAEGDPAEWARELTGGVGPSCAAECSGTAAGLRVCLEAVARLGRVGVVGENHGTVEIGPSEDFIRKGLTVIGTWFMNWTHYAPILDLLRRVPELEKMITHRFPLSEAQEAFETFLSGRSCKVLLHPAK